MKKNILFLVAGLISFLFLQPSFADEDYTPAPKTAMVQVLQNLQTAGYFAIKEIEYEDGIYKVTGLSDKGKKVKAIISPSGEIPSSLPFSKVAPTQPPVTMLQAIQKVVASGCSDIREIKIKSNYYKISGFDSKGKEIEFKVDKTTGKVSKEWF